MTNLAESKVLVTGGAGLIGSHLTDALIARGCRVNVLDSLEPYTHPDGRPVWLSDEANLIVADILDREAMLEALRGVDYVFHQVGFTGFDADSARYIDVNTTSTARLFDLIGEHKLPVRKVVFASSLSIYGEGTYRCQEHGDQSPPMRPIEQMRRHVWELPCPQCNKPMRWQPTAETAKTEPFTPYAVSKYAGELLALSMGKRYEVPTVALRYAVAYGPRQSIYNAYSTVITTFATLLRNDLPPVLYEDGNQCRDWTFVDDIVSANLHVMEDPRADYRAFNVGNGQPVSVRDVAETLARQLGKSIEPTVPGEFRPGDIRNMVLDISALRAIGWEPRVALDQGVERFLTWFKTLGDVPQLYTGLEKHMRESGELMS